MFPRPPPFAPMMQKAPTIEEEDEPEEEDDSILEVTRLKGVFWPGMDLFDAATPNTRRKRNQKKNTSVAESLERQSQLVEPNEVIFTPLGTLRKSRYISGQIEYDSSPYKLELPTPQPKRRAGRKALIDKDTNASISTKPYVDLEGLSPIKNENQRVSRGPLMPPVKRRKRGFQVFTDDKPKDKAAQEATAPAPTTKHARHPSFGSPAGMHLLTSAFQHSPPFDADGVRQGPPMPDLSNGQPHNSYFADAFAHYQPAFYGVPYYGYSYYGPPPYNYTHHGFMPLAAQQTTQSARTTGPAKTTGAQKTERSANNNSGTDLHHDHGGQHMLEAFEAAQAADASTTKGDEHDSQKDTDEPKTFQEHDDSMTITAPNSVTKD